MATEQIHKYDVSYYAGGKTASSYKYRAIIGLRRQDGSLIGGAYFHRDPATMPDTDEQTGSGYVWCHYRDDDLPVVLDLLRNEKPTFVTFTGGGWSIARISTSLEPVGEGEA